MTVPEMQKLTPFLMFQNGEAEEAMTFYTGLFADGEVVAVEHKPEGGIQLAVFSIAGQQVRCIDSPPVHEFGFTPSVSLFVRCESRAELDKLWAGLNEGGQALMPLDDYGFGPFGWTNDRFGVSWQLSLS
jgi:predicted 3-demethylubiquinone-9 3-methyltransferase (glyoxalase superfamily)